MQFTATRVGLALSLSLALLAGCATTTPTGPTQMTNGVLVGPNGMTLYTFDKDTAGSGKSVCNGPCATNWPALTAFEGDKASGDYSVITRDDGKKQWALKGKPLYYFVKDTKTGDRNGDGFLNNAWHVIK